MMKMKKMFAVLVCSAIMAVSVNAGAMGLATWSYRYGTLTDIAADDQDLLWVRDIMEWSDIEKSAGEIVIPESFHERYRSMKCSGKNIIMVLAYGNSLYSGGGNSIMPTSDAPEYFEEWLNYVRKIVVEFKDEVGYFEIWNEPNLEYANANATAEQYGYLCRETKKAIKEISPDAVVIGGSIAYANSHNSFVRSFYNSGGNEMDAISAHSYRYTSDPEGTWITAIGWLNNVLSGLGYTGPLYLTETGYYTGTAEDAVSEKLQASYLIRMQVMWDNYKKTNGRDGEMFWFFANDWGTNSNDVSANHGLIYSNGTYKEAYYSFKTLNSLIRNKQLKELSKTTDAYKACYVDNATGDEVYILWNRKENEECVQTVSYDCDEVRVYDYKGSLQETNPGGAGSISITADERPVFVECSNKGTTISSAVYSAAKRCIRVTGKCNYSDSVTIEIEKDGVVCDEVTAAVKNGEYSKDVYVSVLGDCTIYAGRKNSDGNNYGSRQLELTEYKKSKGEITNTSVIINNGEVSVSGNVEGIPDGNPVSVMALPENADRSSFAPYSAAYIGQTSITGSGFVHSFKMPPASEGRYKIYLGCPGVSQIYSGDITHGTPDKLVGVYDFTAKNQAEITVTAQLSNAYTESRGARIIIAQYAKDGRLNKADIEDVTVDALTVLPKEYSSKAALDDKTETVKVLILDGEGRLIPLAPCIIPE